MVEEKIAWMVSYLFGLESMAYMTTGLIDDGHRGLHDRVGDRQDHRRPSSSGTRPTAHCSSPAGTGYMHGEPYERILRDIRIFPIFEGANDVLRSFVALTALKPLGEELSELGDLGSQRPDRLDRHDRRLRLRPRPARDPPRPGHAGLRRAVRPRRPGRRPGQAPARRGREPAAQARQGHHRPGPGPQAHRATR